MEDIELKCGREEFEIAMKLFDRSPLSRGIAVEEAANIVVLVDFLMVSDDDEKAAFYRRQVAGILERRWGSIGRSET